MKRIGILGGTFNPVHTEHVRLALSAAEELNLDKLLVMPTYLSPHKSNAPAPSEDRLNMLKIAFHRLDKIEVSDYEIKKQGKSYTYQTVEYFKGREECELFFICGGDMLTDFKTWRYPERVLASCNLAVFGREDFFTDYQAEERYFLKTFGKSFIRLNYVGKRVSSTKIRTYSAFKLPTDGLLDKKVEQYIQENKLYSGGEYVEFVKKLLPTKRLKHTADVIVCALKKVKELGLDREKVVAACTLHDSAKYIDYKTVDGFNLPDGVPAPVVHAFLGAYIAEKVLKVQDQEIIDAIRYHTSGKADMSLLGKLVFVADMLEEGRDYDGVETLRELYEKDDFERCFTECLKEEVIHLINKKQYIYEETLNAYDYYIKSKKEEN
ncbi:MAG: nicotinate (nicotinamide) nucleotide adenylyltransferase [Clostridia bacterium]|nr:nicotinate (nicotinamide) nucleotide adenylyltransferase [Clostridia bacterium]